MRVGILALGCDKNTVDAEYLAGLLAETGCEVVNFDPTSPAEFLDVAVIISCGFIADAREQSVDALVDLATAKRKSCGPARLYVAGCLSQKSASELRSAVPEIDGIVGVGQYEELAKMIAMDTPGDHVAKMPLVQIAHAIPRRALRQKPYSFLKIADGCDHACAFCAIPQMKGPYRSVPPDILLDEARDLVNKGIRELNLVAQDITQYGYDLEGITLLPDLLRALCRIEGDFWIRLLYVYPGGINDALVDAMANEEKIVPYMDLPLQHFDPAILRRMRRPFHDLDMRGLVWRLRREVPGLAIRTSLIVGFPGETIHVHRRMLAAMRELRLERVGAFIYSREPDTPAAVMPRQVGHRVAQRRYNAVMEAQAEISAEWQKSRIGQEIPVLIEEYDEFRDVYVGRGYAEAPDVDGVVYVQSDQALTPGQFVKVRVTAADTYDIGGSVIRK